MSVLDECDTEYIVKTSLSDSVFYERGAKKSSNTWGLRVIRKLAKTSKTIRILRQKGLISRWEAFLGFNSIGNLTLKTAIVSIILLLASSTLVMVGTLSSLIFLVLPGAVFLVISFIGICFCSWIEETKTSFMNNLFEKVYKQFEMKNECRIELPWEEQELYEFAKILSKKGGQEEVKKQLFDVLSKYPTEVNERINELFKMKEAIPEDSEEGQIVLSDVDAMLDKLFDVRDTPVNTKIVEQVKKVLSSGIRHKKMKDMGVSVEKLSEIADFVNTVDTECKTSRIIRNNLEVSTVLNEMNGISDTDYEIVQEPNIAKKHTSWQ